MAIGIYIQFEGKVVQIPVNPSRFVVTTSSGNETVNTINLGEVNRLGKEGLKEVTFESFFEHDTSRSYVIGKNKGAKPSFFVSFIERIKKSQKPCRLVISGSSVNFLASVETFEYTTGDLNDEDISYSISFKEFKDTSAKFVKIQLPKRKQIKPKEVKPKPKAVVPKKKQRQSTNKQVTIGCTVIVNGRLHRDSYGSAPGQTERNATRKVNFINKKGTHPYHVTTMNGGWRGWVTKDSVVVK